MMFSDVEIKLKKGNRILFSHDSECLQDLIRLMQRQNRRTLVMWASDCAGLPLARFEEKYPKERRPSICLELCEAWARGKIEMPVAQRAILDCHAVAKEITDKEYGALCHAIVVVPFGVLKLGDFIKIVFYKRIIFHMPSSQNKDLYSKIYYMFVFYDPFRYFIN
jgi:hypothetical protein